MKAVVARRPGAFAVEEVPTPQEPPPGGVVVEVEAAGVCAADRMLWTGRHPWGALDWPMTPGHELLGRVVASDAPVEVGTRVTAEVMLPCGGCPACLRRQEHLCPQGRHLGSGVPGAFAERLALPAQARLHAVPDALSMRQAVLAEPMACALHAVRRAGVRAGDRVAVAGLGGLGALAAVAARAQGAGHVTAVVRSDAKTTLARELGYDAVTTEPDASSYDCVLDVSGSVEAVAALLRAVRPGGRVGVYGVYAAPLTLDLNAVAELGELTVSGGHLAPGCFPDAVRLLEQVDGTRVVTAVRPLREFGTALAESAAPRLKEVLVP